MKYRIILINILLLIFCNCKMQNSTNLPSLFEIIPATEMYEDKHLTTDEQYEFIGETDLMVDERIFRLEDIPKNIPEEIIIKDFFYTITAEFNKKNDILANIDSLINSIENEKRNFIEGIYIKSYIIHRITTLTEEQYGKESISFNPLFYWGWQQRINEFGLTEYKIVNVDFTVIFSHSGSQWGDGRHSRSFIVGKNSKDITYRIYDYGVVYN